MKKLTLKEQRFVDAYLGVARGNGTEAAALAGYGRTRISSRQLATRLLRKVHVQQAIATRTNRAQVRSILTADERDQLLSTIARRHADGLDPTRAIRAIAELNKCTGRHSIKHMHEGTLTLEQVLGESRK